MDKLKIILRVVTFCIIGIILFCILQNIFIPKTEYTTIIKEFYEEPKDSLDILFMGDSSIYRGISPMQLWKEYGYAGYDFSSPAQKTWDQYYCLEEALQYQKPKARFRIPYVRALKPKEYSLKTPYNANLQTPGSFKSQLEDISAWTEYIHLNISIIMRIAFVRSLARIWILTLLIIARCIIHPTEMRNAL